MKHEKSLTKMILETSLNLKSYFQNVLTNFIAARNKAGGKKAWGLGVFK